MVIWSFVVIWGCYFLLDFEFIILIIFRNFGFFVKCEKKIKYKYSELNFFLELLFGFVV